MAVPLLDERDAELSVVLAEAVDEAADEILDVNVVLFNREPREFLVPFGVDADLGVTQLDRDRAALARRNSTTTARGLDESRARRGTDLATSVMATTDSRDAPVCIPSMNFRASTASCCLSCIEMVRNALFAQITQSAIS